MTDPLSTEQRCRHYYPHLCRDFAYLQQGITNVAGPEHFALNDARSLMAAMRLKGVTVNGNG